MIVHWDVRLVVRPDLLLFYDPELNLNYTLSHPKSDPKEDMNLFEPNYVSYCSFLIDWILRCLASFLSTLYSFNMEYTLRTQSLSSSLRLRTGYDFITILWIGLERGFLSTSNGLRWPSYWPKYFLSKIFLRILL
jgi:hypothetical protein